MNCKNCQEEIADKHAFCAHCGAKIIREPITFKRLVVDSFTNAIGWDSRFFITLRRLITQPEKVFSAYISGVRKKYVNPLAFFAIGMTISLLSYNIFMEEFIHYLEIYELNQTAEMNSYLSENADQFAQFDEAALAQLREQNEAAAAIQSSILKYYNFYSFALLPLYAFIGFLVYWKKNNYAEQLVINGYIQGVTFILIGLIFVISMLVHPPIIIYTSFITILFYWYAYSRFYKQSIGKALLYLLKFLGILILLIIVMSISSFILVAIF